MARGGNLSLLEKAHEEMKQQKLSGDEALLFVKADEKKIPDYGTTFPQDLLS